jgi:hypothetical protein
VNFDHQLATVVEREAIAFDQPEVNSFRKFLKIASILKYRC